MARAPRTQKAQDQPVAVEANKEAAKKTAKKRAPASKSSASKKPAVGVSRASDPASNRPAPFIVVGAGLSGTLMAIFLARRGFSVELVERRSDPRIHEAERGRSINMALSERGLNALRAVGLESEVYDLCIPMYGRGVHAADGTFSRHPYGRQGQHINSISRRDLNLTLLEAAAKEPAIRMHFDARVESVELDAKRVNWRTPNGKKMSVQGRLIIGADGTTSVVRDAMIKRGYFNYSQEYLSHGYKELLIPAAEDGGPKIDPNHLHIWPRHEHMLIALANQDNSFTATLFLAQQGEESFASLLTPEEVHAFFTKYFPEAMALIPDLVDQFFVNPVGSMVSLQIEPSYWNDHAVVIGDAAHAMVPFYGQGMNAAFEDCFELDRLFDLHDPNDIGTIIETFSTMRRPHTEAIRQLAKDNFLEMRSSVVKPAYLVKKQVERVVQSIVPNRFIPMYSMISFTNIPYQDAVERAARQDQMLLRGGLVGAGALMGLGAATVGLASLLKKSR